MDIQDRDRILICGTGRCGTTFLMILLTFLGLDTGYTKDTYQKFIFASCNAGLENCDLRHRYSKVPSFIERIPDIMENHPSIDVRYVIVPIRNFDASAQSRVRNGKEVGGLWNAKDATSQTSFYHELMARYVVHMTQYDIPTIFLDFERMTTYPEYLYEKLAPTFPEGTDIDMEFFRTCFDEACEVASRKSKSNEKQTI